MSSDRTVRRSRRLGVSVQVLALLAVPVLLLTSCNLSDITDPVVKPVEELFGLNDGEIATPRFEIVNGITIQVVVRFDDLSAGLPITVHVRCAGGTEASGTVTVTDTGSVSVGQTTFHPAWPAGTDCLVSQEIVHGVETVQATITWLDSNDVRAVFQNT